jgi:hypothetical protein
LRFYDVYCSPFFQGEFQNEVQHPGLSCRQEVYLNP